MRLSMQCQHDSSLALLGAVEMRHHPAGAVAVAMAMAGPVGVQPQLVPPHRVPLGPLLLSLGPPLAPPLPHAPPSPHYQHEGAASKALGFYLGM